MLLNPLAEKFRSLLPPGKIIYVNECGGSIAGRNCSCDPHTSPVCGGCGAGHPGQPPLRQISPALTHISIDMYLLRQTFLLICHLSDSQTYLAEQV